MCPCQLFYLLTYKTLAANGSTSCPSLLPFLCTAPNYITWEFIFVKLNVIFTIIIVFLKSSWATTENNKLSKSGFTIKFIRFLMP